MKHYYLNQYIALCGLGSRRQASRLIEKGVVSVNGVAGERFTKVTGEETVLVDGVQASLPEAYHYILYNKPVGVDCNCRPDDAFSIVNQLNLPTRVFPVGRIDKDSHGLMLLTNDGELCERLLSPRYSHPKEYWVEVQPHYRMPDIDRAFQTSMEQGVELDGQLTLPCRLELLSRNRFKITLIQGLNRQIRRMSRSLGYRVVDLQRVRIVNLRIDGLKVGEYRSVTEEELRELHLHLQKRCDLI